MNGFRAYGVTSSLVGGIFGGIHGHQHRKKRMGESLPPWLAIAGSARDVFIGGAIAPLVFPFLAATALFPALNHCPFSPKSPPDL